MRKNFYLLKVVFSHTKKWIYVLLIQENKFYVAFSESPIGERMLQVDYLVPSCAGASGATRRE
jgi:hypothetical protein